MEARLALLQSLQLLLPNETPTPEKKEGEEAH
jgi:hypothetical protein